MLYNMISTKGKKTANVETSFLLKYIAQLYDYWVARSFYFLFSVNKDRYIDRNKRMVATHLNL